MKSICLEDEEFLFFIIWNIIIYLRNMKKKSNFKYINTSNEMEKIHILLSFLVASTYLYNDMWPPLKLPLYLVSGFELTYLGGAYVEFRL